MTPEEKSKAVANLLTRTVSNLMRVKMAMRDIDSSDPELMAEGMSKFLGRKLSDEERKIILRLRGRNA